MWILDIIANVGKMSPIQMAILMEFAKSGEKPKQITEIIKILKDTFEGLWIPKKGTVYPAVHNLHVPKGYLRMHATKPYGYTITQKGSEAIEAIIENIHILQMQHIYLMLQNVWYKL